MLYDVLANLQYAEERDLQKDDADRRKAKKDKETRGAGVYSSKKEEYSDPHAVVRVDALLEHNAVIGKLHPYRYLALPLYMCLCAIAQLTFSLCELAAALASGEVFVLEYR